MLKTKNMELIESDIMFELNSLIDNYIEMNHIKSDGEFVSKMSEEIKISRSHFYDLRSGKRRPSPEMVLKICKFITKRDELNEIAENVSAGLAKLIISSFIYKSSVKEHDSTIDEFLYNNELEMKIYLMCSGHGVDRKRIKDKFGEVGGYAIARLLDRSIIKIVGERLQLGNVGLSADFRNHGRLSSILTRNFYRPKATLERNANIINNGVESVSERANYEIIRETEEYLERIRKIISKDDKETPANMQTVKIVRTIMVDRIE